ncbi:hypothetical protein J2W32_002672 [Variovorax boronicumulans]|uniref:Uncharacterized protein n=1 Tax=Variovorax boronicumulans TaxID=436515 RepID=A0AAW8CY45_9BURK|nr:hypothetical protein [Variovorax boronicumulans]MDP9893807.1 hypothetical protein [Variovorax boronicumulans]MDQ0053624.1 hypothetical protein [Variovorax boronicumulans]
MHTALLQGQQFLAVLLPDVHAMRAYRSASNNYGGNAADPAAIQPQPAADPACAKAVISL